ncbi:NADH-ubiquinone oxidoreductase chain 1 [Geranomyces variabilis]|uniref:Kinesin-like protein n=1 Tax=Geranomyces variabilis TaxID=109894 RepID=A0AAD5TSF7_9FUNG|nr:NADH-ubiquinone oxidoreductase chain 1 [Geranomyces variabilis]
MSMFSGLRMPSSFRFGSAAALAQGEELPPPVPDKQSVPSILPTPSSRLSPQPSSPIMPVGSPSPFSATPSRLARQASAASITPTRTASERNITGFFPSPGARTRSNSSATINGASPVSGNDACHVTVRMRPLTESEESQNNACVWEVSDEHNRITLNQDFADKNRKTASDYFFDAVQVGSDNKDLYEDSARDVVRAAMEGINGTVFAYGQTASGKTYSMMGVNEEPGVIPQAVEDIFTFIRDQSGDREFLLRVSYLEIYNETIRDLLSPEQNDLRIHEDRKRGVFVAPLKEEIVTSPKQVMRVIRKGEENRHFGATDYNEHSSRSHTIFQMVIESRERTASGAASPRIGGPGPPRPRGTVMISQLNLIDLAGSEKATTDVARRTEGAFINKSLLTLGTVISKLTDGKIATGSHIPYRDSKLTRILQSSLSGNARISVICTISPAGPNVEETQNTLKFASRVKKVTVHASANKIVDEKALLQKYKQEIDELRSQLSTTNELLEQERRQQQSGGLESERKKYEDLLVEAQIARTRSKERIDHLTRLILSSKTITSKHILDWSAPGDPSSARNSVMLEDGLLPTSPNMNRAPSSSASRQFADKGFLDRHIREIDARDEKIRAAENEINNLRAVLAVLKSSSDTDVVQTIDQYEKTGGQSIKSMRTTLSELDKAQRQKNELEVVCAGMEDQIKGLEEKLRAVGVNGSGGGGGGVEDLIDENRALKSTIKGLRFELDHRLGSASPDTAVANAKMLSQLESQAAEQQAVIAQQQSQNTQLQSEVESLTSELRHSHRTIATLRDSIRMLEVSSDMFVQAASRAHSPTNTQTSSGSAPSDVELALERERKLRAEEGRANVEKIASLEAELAMTKAELGAFGLVGAFGALGNGASSPP